jgi:DNA-binding response OmpR family regulator
MRVLVIDDEPDILLSMELLFGGEEFDLETASSFDDAIACAEARPPDVVITDYRMQGKDGLELVRRLMEFNMPMRVAMMTAFPDSTLKNLAMEAGCTKFFAKPFLPDELRAWILSD